MLLLTFVHIDGLLFRDGSVNDDSSVYAVGQIVGQSLRIVYDIGRGGILYANIEYNVSSKRWAINYAIDLMCWENSR